MPVQDRRRFIRHPVAIPLLCQREGHEDLTGLNLRDMSYGGLAFSSDAELAPGDCVQIRFPDLRHPGGVRGEIVWSGPATEGRNRRHVYGMRFQDEGEHFHGRLIEQICHIESYRRAQEHQHGRKLTPAQAAEEWIARQAGRFPP